MELFIDYFIAVLLILVAATFIICLWFLDKPDNIIILASMIILLLLVYQKWQVPSPEASITRPCTLYDYEYGMNLGNDGIYITSFGDETHGDRHYKVLWRDTTYTIEKVLLLDNY